MTCFARPGPIKQLNEFLYLAVTNSTQALQMIIGYDGKRAFQNTTGLGNYSRSLVTILSTHFPHHKYLLFAPKQTSLFNLDEHPNVQAITAPAGFYKRFPSLWRRRAMVKDIVRSGADIYHGLSNELPQSIHKVAVKTVVTVHDLIFERFPETYNFDERYTHRWKIKHACKTADAIIAISQQTKKDLIDLYQVREEKIFTCYQSCNPIFERQCTPEEKASISKKYSLPGKYFLFVSSIAPRKNLIAICKAMVLLKGKLDIPLVVLGNGKEQKKVVTKFMHINGLEDRLIFLNDLPQAKDLSFTSAVDFPAIYQQAVALIYPSVFEGFGLPVLEALWSRLPVICSDTSSLPEAGGDAALYFPPADHKLLATHMLNVATSEGLADELRMKGIKHAQQFDSKKYADNIMKVYKSVL
jgi:glycosyltransferase involved in cell wall biosynthesis